MNQLVKKLTTRDLFESIWHNYQFPVNTHDRNYSLVISQDIQNVQVLVCMELEEQFVENVAKSTDLPFTFEKTLQGTDLKKENRLGKLFYEMLRLQNATEANQGWSNKHLITFKTRNFVQHKYEVSENLNILYAVAGELNLHIATFCYDPLSKMGEGLLEGELINSFVTRLRETTKRKNFKSKIAERKKESSQSFTKTKRYISRLYANNPSLHGERMAICYRNEFANSITPSESNGHLMQFLAALETDSMLGSPSGWWWKREYMTEVSFRYDLIVFFNRAVPPMYDTYSQHWNSVTRNRGLCFIPPIPPRDFQRCGTLYGYDNFESFLSSTQRMLMRDTILRLESSPIFDNFGMGKFPKSVDVVPHNFGVQPPLYHYPPLQIESGAGINVAAVNTSGLT
ncbi:hypothetical protein [Methylovulum psychrotolerans]|uniref:Uncharacterized protein n=1 Tax=Methylovulum psychrotolerans TaxID=1704499 RepID=A0A1Z4BVA7_9GAMM|nr:hypothetical protein [Methylovulum psychrotolerans]ASF45231.1 hypothetical protein CEK71_03665 [Methylovulum psychrotolerans]